MKRRRRVVVARADRQENVIEESEEGLPRSPSFSPGSQFSDSVRPTPLRPRYLDVGRTDVIRPCQGIMPGYLESRPCTGM